jgi:glycosyltransferase involved in cell wall biosynthesis
MTKNTESEGLSIVIPAYNEEDGIGHVIKKLRAEFPSAQIIVVDDGSSDDTANRAGVLDAEVLQHPFNQGYGASLKTGMRAARREFVAWFDADNEHRPEDLAAMYTRIRERRLVAVIGQRNRSVSLVRAVGKGFIRATTRLFDVKVGNDLNCGLRIFRREVIIKYLSLLPERYSASLTTTMLLAERQYPFETFPIEVEQRIGQSKVRLRDGWNALRKVFRLVLLFAPLRIFFRIGALLIVVGTIYGVYKTVSEGLGFPVAGMLVVVVGIILCMLGLVADQISQFWLSLLQHRALPEVDIASARRPLERTDGS